MKKCFLLVVSTMLLVAMSIIDISAFTDTENYKYADYIDKLVDYKLVVGINENEFGTDQNVTRQQMALFIARVVLGRMVVEPTDYTDKHPFTDVTDPTYDAAISFCYENKIIAGRTQTTFDPFGNVTKQDALTMALRALGYNDLAYPDGYAEYRKYFPGFYDSEGELSVPATRGEVGALMYETLTSSLRKNGEVGIVSFEKEYFYTLEDYLYEWAWEIIPFFSDSFDPAPPIKRAAWFASAYIPSTYEYHDKQQKYEKELVLDGETKTIEFNYWSKSTFQLETLESKIEQMFDIEDADLSKEEYWSDRGFIYILDENGNLCRYAVAGLGGFFIGTTKENISIHEEPENVYAVAVHLIRPVVGKTEEKHYYYTVTIQVLDPAKPADHNNIKILTYEKVEK